MVSQHPSLPYFVSAGTIEHASNQTATAEAPQTDNGQARYRWLYSDFCWCTEAQWHDARDARQGSELLKSVLVASFHRKGVYNRVDGIRSELDEWTMREYNRAELPSEVFFDLYYHESRNTMNVTF